MVDAALAVLGPLPVELIDDLIERGALTTVPAATTVWGPATLAYVRTRVDAAGVADEELRLAGFTAELARRAFLAGDGTLLGELDANDPAVAHYRALLAYRRKRDTAGMAAIRPADRQLVGALDALREAGPDGRRDGPGGHRGRPVDLDAAARLRLPGRTVH